MMKQQKITNMRINNKMATKRIFLDTETTGLNEKTCAIHQLSAIIEIDSKVVETIDLKIRPFEYCVFEESAMKLANLTPEILSQNELSQKEAYFKLKNTMLKYVSKYDKTDKLLLIGYNVDFDKRFLAEFFARNNDNYLFSLIWGNVIDVMSLASEKLENRRKELPNFKLGTVAKFCGIEFNEDELHNSLFDIELTRHLFYKLRSESEKKETQNPLLQKTEPLQNQYIKNTYQLNEFTDIVGFGKKHCGHSVQTVLNYDPQYLLWCNENMKNLTISDKILIEARKMLDEKQQLKKEDDLPF